MKQKGKGVLLMILAVLVAVFFLSDLFFGETGQTETIGTISGAAVRERTVNTQKPTEMPTAAPTLSAAPAATGAVTVEDTENWNRLTVKIDQDILDYLGVTAKEAKRKLREIANAAGERSAESVSDMGEMNVNFAENTVTIPCYFSEDGEMVKFDLIYQTKKKTWRFVLWQN